MAESNQPLTVLNSGRRSITLCLATYTNELNVGQKQIHSFISVDGHQSKNPITDHIEQVVFMNEQEYIIILQPDKPNKLIS